MRIAVLGPLEVLTRRTRARRRAGREGTPAPRGADRRGSRCGQHRPAGRDAVERRPAGLRAQVAAGPCRPAAQLPGAGSAEGLHRPVRRPHGAAVTRWRWTGGTIDALRLGDLAARGGPGSPPGTPSTAARLLDRGAGVCGAASPTRTGRTRRSPRPSAGGWPRCGRGARRRTAGGPARSWAGTPTWSPSWSGSVAEEPLREDWWRLLMLALYRAGRQADALAAGRRVRALLAEELGDGARAGAARGWRRRSSRRTRRSTCVRSRESGRAGRCPARAGDLPLQGPGRLPGRRTRPCSTADGGWWPAWWPGSSTRRCSWSPGPAGPGKSSVVRAGLVPALARGALPGSEAWQPVIVTPGRNPVDVLADLTGESPPAAPGPAGVRPVRGAVGARRRPGGTGRVPRRGPRACSTTGSSSGAWPSCAATTSGGWPSTPRSPSGSAGRWSSSRR